MWRRDGNVQAVVPMLLSLTNPVQFSCKSALLQLESLGCARLVATFWTPVLTAPWECLEIARRLPALIVRRVRGWRPRLPSDAVHVVLALVCAMCLNLLP